MLESCLVSVQKEALNPRIQKIVVKMMEMMGIKRRPTTPTKGAILGRGSCRSIRPAGFTWCTRPWRGDWGTPGLFILSVLVCRATSRKGTVIVKSIQMSIILT